MNTETIQTPTITEADIARGIRTGSRLRSLAVHAALKSLVTALANSVGAIAGTVDALKTDEANGGKAAA